MAPQVVVVREAPDKAGRREFGTPVHARKQAAAGGGGGAAGKGGGVPDTPATPTTGDGEPRLARRASSGVGARGGGGTKLRWLLLSVVLIVTLQLWFLYVYSNKKCAGPELLHEQPPIV